MPEESSPADVAADVAKGAMRVTRRFARRVRTAAEADGAGHSGLAALIATHALCAAGDAMVAVALANTTFFKVSAGEARGKIALYLILALLPFALLIPVAGPLLDRFPHGRRYVLAITAAGRGLTAWTLAGSLASLSLYPQALVILVLQRAYSVARAAAVIRVRPPELGLVAANARMNIAALASSGAAAIVGFSLARAVGTEWDLRVCALLFLIAAVTALRLPDRIDDRRPHAEAKASFTMRTASLLIRRPLVATIALRAATGLLTLGLAILFKADKASVVHAGLVLGAGVAGGLVGTGLASHLSPPRVARITAFALLAPMAACAVAAVLGGTLFEAIAVGSVGLGASLGKYSLDAALQTHVGSSQTGSAFAKSETFLQLGWAAGGAAGLLLSLIDRTGLGYHGALHIIFAVVAAIPVVGLVVVARAHRPAPGAVSGTS
ncbi:MAG: transporter [Frankiales bacterium]|nr:transporter [Frankiales bacterium]